MRVALYARVSLPGKSLDKSQNPENQLEQLREFVRGSKWELVHEYIDRMSGKGSDRPQFKKLFTDAYQRKFDLVVFWALDRFSREGVLATLNHLQRLSSYGVNWRSFQEPYFDSCGPFKDAVISIMASLARIERERISERTKAGLERARRAGKVLGRPEAPKDLAELRRLRESGLSLRQIAGQTGHPLTTVAQALKAKKVDITVISA
jgi:DNA invertase Pin-like site-specific DNA recombinase